MNHRHLALLLLLAGTCAYSQTNTISSVAIGTAVTAGGTANGVALLTPRIGTALNQAGTVSNNLAGLQYVASQVPLTGAPASIAFFALTGAAVPGGAGDPAADFTSYGTLISPTNVVTYADVASKLSPNSYSALTYAAADLGFGAGNFYMVHHTTSTDYLAEIVPGTATSSLVADLKPMSWIGPTAGNSASPGTTGYFGLSWATGILSAGAPYADQSLYYLRTDSSTSPSHTKFGVIIPALTGAASDTLDLTSAVGSFGVGGYTSLIFSPSVLGNFPSNQFYYLRQDTITGNTILGRLNPSLVAGVRTISDIANLGGVFNSLAFAADATGPAGAWGSAQFYASGALPAGAQSISFEAIPDHNIGDVFTITPTASSGLDIDVTVVSGPATVLTTGVSGATPTSLRVFSITTTGPGIVTLQARQAGQTLPTAYTANLLQQSFNVLGVPTITSATSAPGTVNAAFTYTITATGSPTSYTATPLPAGLSLNSATGVISGTPSAAAATLVTLTATNLTGTSSPVTLTITVAPANATPIITSATSAAGTVGTAFSYAIVATGSPVSYTATPLPANLALNSTTGMITGTPSVAAATIVTLTATNGTGTSSPVTLTITVAPANVAPIITSATSAAGTVGTAFTYVIVATGLPASYTASPLPANLVLDSTTGQITGTPTVAATTIVTLTATNGTGTSSPVTLTITVAPTATAPIITSPNSAVGTVGTAFVTYTIVATGLPTSYGASGLPPGLAINSLTGAITGMPTSAGFSVVTLTATNGTGTGTAGLAITIAAAPPYVAPPIITSATTAPGTVGTVFITYTILATGVPTTYGATGLPAGLVVNAFTGRITGTPTAAGVTVAVISANNAGGTGSATLTITVAAATVAPIITSPTTAPGTVGTPFVTYPILATGLPTSYTASGLPPGLTLNPLTGTINGTPTTAGTYNATITATNTAGTSTATLAITVAAAAVAPIITSPGNATGTAGTTFVTYPIVATGLPTSYTATGLPPGLTLNPLTGTINGTPTTAGTYSVTINATNSTGTSSVILTITVAATPFSRIINFSTRAQAGSGNQTLILGFVVAGSNKTLLVRGNGPDLIPFGVVNTLPDPVLTLDGASGQIATNTGWQTSSNAGVLTATAAQFGAFPQPSGSADSALIAEVNAGAFTAQIVGASNDSGTALIEVYDVDSNVNARLVNASARMQINLAGGNLNPLIIGFVIAGNTPKTVLIRGVGPGLSAFGVTGTLANPQITLYSGATALASNANWMSGNNVAQLTATFAQVGAFALTSGSLDAALTFTLQPGSYTVQIIGVGNTSGVALLEVYDVQ